MSESKSMQRAQEIIYSQDVPAAVKRSAWLLYQHELQRNNPVIAPSKALSNTLRWISLQKEKRSVKRLTAVQRQIVYLLAVEGLTQKQIAFRMHRDYGTIRMHISQIRQRFGLTSMYQVVALAVERGWIDAPKIDE